MRTLANGRPANNSQRRRLMRKPGFTDAPCKCTGCTCRAQVHIEARRVGEWRERRLVTWYEPVGTESRVCRRCSRGDHQPVLTRSSRRQTGAAA